MIDYVSAFNDHSQRERSYAGVTQYRCLVRKQYGEAKSHEERRDDKERLRTVGLCAIQIVAAYFLHEYVMHTGVDHKAQ